MVQHINHSEYKSTMSETPYFSLRKLTSERDAQKSNIERLHCELHQLRESKQMLSNQIEKLKCHAQALIDHQACCSTQTKLCGSEPVLNEMLKVQKFVSSMHKSKADMVDGLLQDVNKLNKKMEAQTRMLNLTVNVYLKEKIRCDDALTKDEIKVQRRLHRLLHEKSKHVNA